MNDERKIIGAALSGNYSEFNFWHYFFFFVLDFVLGAVAIADALVDEAHGDSDLAQMGAHEPTPVLEFVAACANQHHVVTL